MMVIDGDPAGGGTPRAGSDPALFDTWLQTSLQQRYDRALDEPVPEEMLDLVRQTSDHPPE